MCKSNGVATVFSFKEGGLHVHDTKDREIINLDPTTLETKKMKKACACEGVALIETVKGNKRDLTKKEIRGAKQARRTYAMIGRPSIRDFKGLIRGNLLKNCPVTVSDIN